MKGKLKEKAWFPYTVAACIAVAFYVLLVHMGSITAGIMTFLGYFRPVFYGAILAYVMNPLAKALQKSVFRNVTHNRLRWNLSIGATALILLLVLGFLLRTLVPQLMNSVIMLFSNMDSYMESLKGVVQKWSHADTETINRLFDSSGSIVRRIQDYFTRNADTVVSASAEAGRGLVTWIISFVLSIYMLGSKDSVKRECKKLLMGLLPEERYKNTLRFFSRCDRILVSYITASLADAVIIGIINALFMSIMGMEYTGLISVVVAITNLIPTFGPIIGGAVGALILLLVKPVHAVIFVIFTFILQFIDPYFIKPKLFGNTLGVSGLLILISVIVCGNIFGVFGLLIAIPLAAIIDFVYKEWVNQLLEDRKRLKKAEKSTE